MEQTSPASRRRAELLASLSPEGRATYEVLRAHLARDLDRRFAESEEAVETTFGDLNTNLDELTSRIDAVKQDLRSGISDLRFKCNRVVGLDNAERATGIMAAATTTTTTSAPVASHGDLPDADGVFPTAPSPTMGTTTPLLHVFEQVTKVPATCSSNCSSNELGTVSPASSTTQGTAARLLPTTTPAFTPELIVQVQVSPSTFSTVSVHEDILDTDDTNDVEGMSLTTSPQTETQTSQSLQWFDDRGLHTSTPTKCLTIGTYSLLLLLPPVALDTVDTKMTERQYIYEDSGNYVQKMDISLIQHVVTVFCLPILQWDENRVWPPPLSPNALVLRLQVYGQKNKCSFLEHVQSGVFLIACGTVFQCIFVYQVTFLGSLVIEKLQGGVISALH